MKLLCFSDIHLTNRNSKFKKTGGVSDLLIRQEAYVKWLRDYAIENDDIDAVLFLGDWTDYPTLDPVTLTYSNRLVASLDQIGLPVILIEGNHCITDRGNKFTVIGATEELSCGNISFVYQEDVIELSLSGQPVRFYCFPYSSDYPSLESRISKANGALDKALVNIMLFHFPTTNAVLDNGLQSKKGVNLSSEITCNFNLCIGGDFHYHQKLINNDKAWYVGAPFSLRFGEHCDRGSVIFEIDDSGDKVELEFLPNPFQFPIRKISYDEAIQMTDDELMNGVYKMTDVDDEQFLKLASIKDRAYKLDIGRSRTEKQLSDNARVMDVISSRRDVAILQSRLDTTELQEADKLRITHLFEKIKAETDEE